MFKNYWKGITNFGVTDDLEFNIKNKLRVFNTSVYVIGAIYMFYTLVSCLRGDYLAGAMTFFSWVVSVGSLILIKKKKYYASFHLTMSWGIIFLYIFCILYGESTQTHVFYMFMPVAAIVLFDNFKTSFIYFWTTIIVLLAGKYMFNTMKPYYPFQPINEYLGYLNIFLTSFLILVSVRMFKNENLRYSKEINTQRDLIDEKNKEILSSIHYAKRIQKALLASDTLLNKHLPEYFILYKPKDIVSGDFYWAEQIESKFMLAVCDCTGHGVPGAFMSLLGVSFMNEMTIERKIYRPDLVFNQLRHDIITVLNPEGTIEEGKDGMDAVLCSFDFDALTVEFACANNPLWVMRDRKMMEFKPDKLPIGMQEGESKPFTLQTLQLQKGDTLYLFTDGYADQFGGEKGKKFKYKQFQELLVKNADLPMAKQHEELNKTIEDWRGELEQVDDILIIGVRV